MNQDEKLEKPIYVYTLSCPKTGDVRYVGVTNNLKKRFSSHIRDNRQNNHRANWVKSLLRDGLEPIMTTIDETNSEEWQQCEIRWIAYYRGLGCNLVNATDGGEGARGFAHTEETRKRISEAGRGKKRTEKTRKRISEARSGKNNPMYGMYGKNHPSYGRKHTEEARKKMSEANYGRITSDETRKRMSEAGRGKTHSNEHRMKISKSNSQKRQVLQYDKFGHFIRQWDGIGIASRELKINHSNIVACCQRKPNHKTVGGYIFRYADDPLLGEYPVQLKLDLE